VGAENGESRLQPLLSDIGGTLDVQFVNGLEPQVNDEFLIVQIVFGTGTNIFGEFDTINAPPGYELGVEVTDTTAVLKVFCVPCAADLDPNGTVNVADLLQMLANWGTDGPGADLAPPYDTVNVSDLLELLSAWGDCPCIIPG